MHGSLAEFVKHIRLVHFTLVVVSSIFLLFLLFDKEYRGLADAKKELQQIEKILNAYVVSDQPDRAGTIHEKYQSYLEEIKRKIDPNNSNKYHHITPINLTDDMADTYITTHYDKELKLSRNNVSGWVEWPDKSGPAAEHVILRSVKSKYDEEVIDIPDGISSFIDFWDSALVESDLEIIHSIDIEKPAVLTIQNPGGVNVGTYYAKLRLRERLFSLVDHNTSDVDVLWQREIDRPKDLPKDSLDEVDIVFRAGGEQETAVDVNQAIEDESDFVCVNMERRRLEKIATYDPDNLSVEQYIEKHRYDLTWSSFDLNCEHVKGDSAVWRSIRLADRLTAVNGSYKTQLSRRDYEEWRCLDFGVRKAYSDNFTIRLGVIGQSSRIKHKYIDFLDSLDLGFNLPREPFKDAFPNAHALIKVLRNTGDVTFSSLYKYIEQKESSINDKEVQVPIIGFSIPDGSKYAVGKILLVVVMLYFYMHVATLSKRLSIKSDAFEVPWIGLYHTITAGLTLLVSVVILPNIVLIYAWSHYRRQFELLDIVYLSDTLALIGMLVSILTLISLIRISLTARNYSKCLATK